MLSTTTCESSLPSPLLWQLFFCLDTLLSAAFLERCFYLLPKTCSTDQQALDVTWECVKTTAFWALPYLHLWNQDSCFIRNPLVLTRWRGEELLYLAELLSPLPTAVSGPLPSLPTMQYSQFFLEVLTSPSGWPSAYRTRAPPLQEGWKWATPHSLWEELTHWIYSISWYSASYPGFFECKFTSVRDFHFRSSIKRLTHPAWQLQLHPFPCTHSWSTSGLAAMGPSWYDRDNSESLTHSLGPLWHHCPEYLNWIQYPKTQVASASTFSPVSCLSLYSDLRTHSWVCPCLVLKFYSIPNGKLSPQCLSLLLASLLTLSSPQDRCWFILPAACKNLPWPWKLGTISSLVLKDAPGKVIPLGQEPLLDMAASFLLDENCGFHINSLPAASRSA